MKDNMDTEKSGLINSLKSAKDRRPFRSKHTHPYSYDEFTIWESPDGSKDTQAVYSDRLLQWDWDKHNDLCKKYFGNEGQYWGERDRNKIEAFLRDYNDDQTLELKRIVEGCNQSSGYPYWIFFYTTKKES